MYLKMNKRFKHKIQNLKKHHKLKKSMTSWFKMKNYRYSLKKKIWNLKRLFVKRLNQRRSWIKKLINNNWKYRSLKTLLTNKKYNSMQVETIWFNNKKKWILFLKKSSLSFSKRILSFRNKFRIFKRRIGSCKFHFILF